MPDESELLDRLVGIVAATPPLMQVLRTARDLDLPDWLVFSGAVYQPVLNHLTGRPLDYGIKDYDFGYFDASDISYEAEDAVIRRVAAAFDDPLRSMVEVRNQARVHLWFEHKFGEAYAPLSGTAEALERFTTTMFAVGVQLGRDDRLKIVAPFGLADLFALRLRPNPRRRTNGFARTVASAAARWPELRVEGTTGLDRPSMLGGKMPDDLLQIQASAPPSRADYTVKKGDVSLAVYRKRHAPVPGAPPPPVLFLVHGSSNSGLSSFDLSVPGAGEYSTMNVFAGLGFDVWTMDHENYGRSSRTEGNSDIASGVGDLAAATELVIRETGQQRLHFMGESSGALRAAAFAMVHPERVGRLVLNAFTYTGRNSPTLAKRAEQVDFFRTHNRRLRDRAMISSIFTRDHPGTSDPAVAEALADAELIHGDQVPTGTYLDMTANLPVVDPLKVLAPVMIVRGEHDGIASEEDLLDFYRLLPNPDRQFVVLPGAAHALVFGHNRHHLWHMVHAFLTMPPRRDEH